MFHGLVHAAPGYEQLRLTGLKKDARYRITSLAQALRVGQFGSLLKHVAPVNLNPNGLIMHTADHHITMPDGTQELTVSGSGLMAGVRLLPLFRGTGYDQRQRTLADFGSEIYIIEEETNCEKPGKA